MPEQTEEALELGFFDRHSAFLCLLVTFFLLIYTTGLLLVWWGLTLGTQTEIVTGAYLVVFPTFLALLNSFAPIRRNVVFDRVHVKTYPTWLLLNETFRLITTIDVMMAGACAFVPALFAFSTAVRPGLFTVDKVALVWSTMAVLALFSVIYGRSLMQILGMKYETFPGRSLLGASAYAALASFMFRNRKNQGLDYLMPALKHAESVLSARGSELEDILSTRLAVESIFDGPLSELLFERLRVLADDLAKLPNLLELPADLRRFLTEIKWPREIKPVKRRTYGIQWFAATATITAAVVGLATVLVQASGQNSFANAILTPASVLLIGAVIVFIAVGFVYYSLTQDSVDSRVIDAFEKDLILRSEVKLGKRTTLSTIALIPKTIAAAFTAVLAVLLGFSLGAAALVSYLYEGRLPGYTPEVYIVAIVFFMVFLLMAYALIRNLRQEFRSKKEPEPSPAQIDATNAARS
ncbi:MAG: hypothetical protein ABSF83_01495 [Nitrososphaerales archaeon]|jgi:hypothetical protein